MKSTSKKIAYIVAGIALIYLFGVAGTYDWAEEITSGMPVQIYKAVMKDVGNSASQIKIAEHYQANRAYYDSLYETGSLKPYSYDE